jgi:hypothetical protein
VHRIATQTLKKPSQHVAEAFRLPMWRLKFAGTYQHTRT